MRDIVGKLAGLLASLACLIAPLRAAEEAWRPDGRHLRGRLTLDRGELHFTPREGEEAPLARFTRVRFADASPTPFRAGGGRRVRLRDGQIITGQIVGLDKDTLTLRTAWAARLELPRIAVASVDPLPGWRIVAEERFRDGAKELTHTLANPLRAGRFGVNFQQRGTVELLFQQGDRSRRVTVTIADKGENYEVDAGGLKGTARAVARTPGWHRLIVGFTKRSLRVTCDDEVLWYNLEQGPDAALKQVTIRCQQSSNGADDWEEFCLERAVKEYPRPLVDSEQDEIQLGDGDQLFGRILKADRHTLEIEGRFGKRSLPWTAAAGCTFRRPADPPRRNQAANVRLLVRSGLCPEADVLEGMVTALDERRLTLRHVLLGELTFERGRVRELRPLASK
ncbi:MAG TPA: hypothetical protein VH643_37730 [Gemmataceae bacterium]|jgi:hypothetical protein